MTATAREPGSSRASGLGARGARSNRLGGVLAAGLVIACSASAQVVRPMGETPYDPGPGNVKQTPEAPVSAASRTRYSSFSAGRGGPLFAFSQIVDGLVVGGVLGTALTASSPNPLASSGGAYIGALTGGVSLGALGVVLQYFQPIGMVAAGAATLGLGVGALAGAGVASLLASMIPNLTATLPGILALAGSEIGALVPLALLWSKDDLEPSDLALMSAVSLYAFAATTLLNLAIDRPLWTPGLLIAPALGLAVGGLVAALSTIPLGEVVRSAALPLGIGLSVFYLGALLSTVQLGAIASLSAMALTFGVTAIVTWATREPKKDSALTMIPTLGAASSRSGALVPTLGLAVTF